MAELTLTSWEVRTKYLRALYFLLNGSFPDSHGSLTHVLQRVITDGFLKRRNGSEILEYSAFEQGTFSDETLNELRCAVRALASSPAREESLLRLGPNALLGLDPAILRNPLQAKGVECLLGFENKRRGDEKKAQARRRLPQVPIEESPQVNGVRKRRKSKEPTQVAAIASAANVTKTQMEPTAVSTRTFPRSDTQSVQKTSGIDGEASLRQQPPRHVETAKCEIRSATIGSALRASPTQASENTVANWERSHTNSFAAKSRGVERKAVLETLWQASDLACSLGFDLDTAIWRLSTYCNVHKETIREVVEGRRSFSVSEFEEFRKAHSSFGPRVEINRTLWLG